MAEDYTIQLRIVKPMDDAYLLALGKFVHTFAGIEHQVSALLTQEAGLSRRAGAALFSGVRTDQATNFIRRLYEARRMPAKIKVLEGAFLQLAQINTARNMLLHHGASWTGDDQDVLIVTNDAGAHAEDRIQVRPISPEILEAMTSDLTHIGLHITRAMGLLRYFPEEMRASADEALRAPWRYKPPASPRKKGENNKSPPPKNQVRTDQPKPSGP